MAALLGSTGKQVVRVSRECMPAGNTDCGGMMICTHWRGKPDHEVFSTAHDSLKN